MGVRAPSIPNASIARIDGNRYQVQRISITSMPREFLDEVGAAYETINTGVGVGEPDRIYQNTSARRLSFGLRYWTHVSAYKDVIEPVNWLRSMVYPIAPAAAQGGDTAPPEILLKIGQFLSLRGIVIDVPVTWRTPYEVGTMLPMLADVQLVIEAHMRVGAKAVGGIGQGAKAGDFVLSEDIARGAEFTGGPQQPPVFQAQPGRVPLIGLE